MPAALALGWLTAVLAKVSSRWGVITGRLAVDEIRNSSTVKIASNSNDFSHQIGLEPFR
jgi:hypothetical protein